MLGEAKLIPDKYEDDKALVLKAVFSSLNFIGTFAWQSRIRPQDIDVCYVYFSFLLLFTRESFLDYRLPPPYGFLLLMSVF